MLRSSKKDSNFAPGNLIKIKGEGYYLLVVKVEQLQGQCSTEVPTWRVTYYDLKRGNTQSLLYYSAKQLLRNINAEVVQ